ncbi:MAG TPA: hypothetical protein VNJ52_02590 [Patescibacteria group bacterium]|nr:hypothetical protein [Patescibacteria group bacterium]
MKCHEFAEIVHDLARSGQLDEAEAAIARAHAETCPGCACLLLEAEALVAMFREASAGSRSLGAPARVESAVVAAFRNANAANGQRARRWKPSWRLALAGVYAAAAVALIVFASLGRPPQRPPLPAARAGSATPAALAAAGQNPSVAQTVSGHESLAAESDANRASGFVPVPFAGGFAQGDAGVIVRVQVPRAALAELGYPVDEAQGEGMVQADLLVGEDGWPHAVRIAK